MSSNNSNTQETTFWKFLTDYTIEIPIIQRDYAQGRLGKEFLRKSFLTDLKNALDPSNSQEKMKLDFVYGSVENGKLSPLDGQQRLTTLWLLHWYIALMSGNLNEEVCKTLAKFTYETRISSREFCENLCKPENFSTFNDFKPTEKRRIVDYIISRTWFYSAWKQDPTIQSMLRMLGGTEINDKNGKDIVDGLEEVFQNCNKEVFEKYWKRLISETPIVFYHLQLKDFGRSDDLYIKMNARGKQLTSFENFKADLIGYISKRAEETFGTNEQIYWKSLLETQEGIPIKIDTVWTDIFWRNRSQDKSIDEIYFAFLNRFLLSELVCQKEEQVENKDYKYTITIEEIESNDSFKYLYGDEGDDSKIEYVDLGKYKYCGEKISSNVFKSLITVLDNYKEFKELYVDLNLENHFPQWVGTSFSFIPTYKKVNTISTLTQKERVVFLAIARYLEKGVFENKSFKQWMRVVWNIVENANIKTIAAMIGAMRLIDELSNNSHKIYVFLAQEQTEIKSEFAEEQVKEEIAKAKQILKDNRKLRDNNGGCKKDSTDYNTWESKIIEAEKYAFFKGAIRFLFTDEKGEVNWDNFDTKWKNATEFFDKEGIKDGYKVEITKKLVTQCSDWRTQLYDQQVFNPNAGTWKWILCSSTWSEPINNILMNKIVISTSLGDDSANKYIKPIINHLPYKTFINEYPEGRFRNIVGRLAYYKPYGRDFIMLDFDGFQRNTMLRELLNNKIEINNSIKDSNLYFWWGWDINFKYEEIFFQWKGKPNDKEMDVYLMKKDWEDYLKKKGKNNTTNNNTDENNYFCFNVKENMTSKDFLNQLKCLIWQKQADENNQPCIKGCINNQQE